MVQHLIDERVSDDKAYLIPDEVASIVRRQFRPNPEWQEMLPGELARCFGTSGSKWLVRHSGKAGAKISLKCVEGDATGQNPLLEFDFDLDEEGFSSRCSISDSTPLRIDGGVAEDLMARHKMLWPVYLAFPSIDDLPGSPSELIILDVSTAIGKTLSKPFRQSAHYLPADRTGTMHGHRAIVSSMISSAPTAGLGSGVSLPSLSGVLADFLVQLLSIGDHEEDEGKDSQDDLGHTIERHLLSGKIQTDRSNTTYPVFSYRPNGWDKPLPLMNASSMVSELAPVVLFLRHVVKPGEVLIIEEPEAHLHPAMQVELMRQLAAVVNAGVRIMITTHSEWILDELANLVRLSELPPEKRTARLKNEPALDPRDVGVWLFEQGEGDEGSHVKELPFDLNEGGFATGYEDTARLTYNQWAAIHNLLQK